MDKTQTFNNDFDTNVPAEPSTSVGQLAKEQEAITRLKQGNIDGLEWLVKTYQVKAVQAALLIIGDRDTAEDIVQEAFLQAFRKIGQFEDHRPFSPWFLRSVIHSALKTAARQKKVEALDEPEQESRVTEWLIDPSLGPQEFLETTEMREIVWQAMNELSPEQRTAIVLKYFLDESEYEIVQQLNRPVTTVKWWLYSARRRLKIVLRPINSAAEKQEDSHEE